MKVSPAELEAVLVKHDAILEVAVVGKPDENAGELPIAFVVKHPGREAKKEEIVNFFDSMFASVWSFEI